MLLGVAIVARMKAVEVGEHSQSLGTTPLIEDAHPHRASIFQRVCEIELPAFHVFRDEGGNQLGDEAASPDVSR